VTFSAVAFCADASLKSVFDIAVGGTMKLNIRAKTPIKIILVYRISFKLVESSVGGI
jgi:hypothetical protein